MQKDKQITEREFNMASVLEPIELVLARELCRKYGISEQRFTSLVGDKIAVARDTFPAVILRGKLSSLEAIVKYLRENRKLSYKEIGELLSRNPTSLASSYASSKRQMQGQFPEDIEEDSTRISFDVFRTGLSVLEAICHSLRMQGKRFVEISRITGKDQRTVWTACRRAERKLKS